jgi:hypothetical protein
MMVEMVSDGFPTYSELRRRTDAPAGSSWGIFGDAYELGTLNFLPLGRSGLPAAFGSGRALALDYPVSEFDPPIVWHRKIPIHTIYSNGTAHRDDFINQLYPQASSHIDGLRHIRHPIYGFYNGVEDDRITVGDGPLGVDRWATKGIVGRGLLIDVASYFTAMGREIDLSTGHPLEVGDLVETLAWQGSAVAPGDVLLLRTGWADWYRRQSPDRLPAQPVSTGLAQSYETLAWLWDNRISMVAADNLGVECFPPLETSPFRSIFGPGCGLIPGMMHPDLIAMLGFVLGELWNLGPLAASCQSRSAYTCVVVCKPIFLPGGVGTPAHALAIF